MIRINIDRAEATWEDAAAETAFFRVVRAGFSQKRKQLKNNLRHLGLSDEAIAAALAAVGIDGKRRAETLAMGEWEALVQTLDGDDLRPPAATGGIL